MLPLSSPRAAGNQQPTTNNQQPTTNNQQPTTNNQQPTTNNIGAMGAVKLSPTRLAINSQECWLNRKEGRNFFATHADEARHILNEIKEEAEYQATLILLGDQNYTMEETDEPTSKVLRSFNPQQADSIDSIIKTALNKIDEISKSPDLHSFDEEKLASQCNALDTIIQEACAEINKVIGPISETVPLRATLIPPNNEAVAVSAMGRTESIAPKDTKTPWQKYAILRHTFIMNGGRINEYEYPRLFDAIIKRLGINNKQTEFRHFYFSETARIFIYHPDEEERKNFVAILAENNILSLSGQGKEHNSTLEMQAGPPNKGIILTVADVNKLLSDEELA